MEAQPFYLETICLSLFEVVQCGSALKTRKARGEGGGGMSVGGGRLIIRCSFGLQVDGP